MIIVAVQSYLLLEQEQIWILYHSALSWRQQYLFILICACILTQELQGIFPTVLYEEFVS